MSFMFSRSIFNGDISKWNTGKVRNTSYMFEDSHFNGNISNWNLSKVKNKVNMFRNSLLTEILAI
jgi:hypothetical protein